jgi:hypothetical protein
MNEPITFGQLLGVSITLLLAVVAGIIKVISTVTKNEVRIKTLEDRYFELRQQQVKDNGDIKTSLLELKNGQIDIKVALQNKQDRK